MGLRACVIASVLTLTACATSAPNPFPGHDSHWADCSSLSDPNKTIAACQAIIDGHQETDGFVAGAYNNMANAYSRLGQNDQAIQAFNQAIAFNPQFTRAYTNRGNLYRAEGKFDLAIRDYDQSLSIDPNFALAHANTGVIYLLMKKPEITLAEENLAIKLDPRNAVAFYSRGLAKKMLGREDADADLASARSLDSQVALNFKNLHLGS